MWDQLVLASDVNMSRTWSDVWDSLDRALGPISDLIAGIGVILVVFSVVKWLWDRRRGGGGGMGGGQASGVMWTLLVGAVLIAPSVLLPLILTILDAVVNAVVHLWRDQTASAVVPWMYG